jgi:hypothetical protein
MEHLAKHYISYDSLSLTNILCNADGQIKIGNYLYLLFRSSLIRTAWFEHCIDTGFTSARVLGLLGLALMQKGLLHLNFQDDTLKITLQDPKDWSAEAANFIETCSFIALSEVKKVHYYLNLSGEI